MPLPRYNKKTIKGVYTEDEKRYLFSNAGKVPVEEMAKALGKTVDSVMGQCQKQMLSYGIKQHNRSSWQ